MPVAVVGSCLFVCLFAVTVVTHTVISDLLVTKCRRACVEQPGTVHGAVIAHIQQQEPQPATWQDAGTTASATASVWAQTAARLTVV